jgi:hypothetical protein
MIVVDLSAKATTILGPGLSEPHLITSRRGAGLAGWPIPEVARMSRIR